MKGRTSGEATGIGLYLVKKILTTLEHPFTLQSSEHVTTFSINFSNSLKNEDDKVVIFTSSREIGYVPLLFYTKVI